MPTGGERAGRRFGRGDSAPQSSSTTRLAEPPRLSDDACRDFRAFLGSAEGNAALGELRARLRVSAPFRDRDSETLLIVRSPARPAGPADSGPRPNGLRQDGRACPSPERSAPTGVTRFCLLNDVTSEAALPDRNSAVLASGLRGKGALATLLVWDGMRDVAKYREMLRYLTSRRKVVLVGSAYRVTGSHRAQTSSGSAVFDSRRDLPESVAPMLLIRLSVSLCLLAGPTIESFLVALYRLLPPSRPQLRTGVTREATRAETVLAQRAAELPRERQPRGVLAQALLDAGLLGDQQLGEREPSKVAGEMLDDFQLLTGLVMVPDDWVCVPLELLLRSLEQGVQ